MALLVYAITRPSTYKIERSIHINCKPDELYHKVIYSEKFSSWYPFNIIGKDVVFNYEKNAINNNENIRSNFDFERVVEFDVLSADYRVISFNNALNFVDLKDKTKVVWKVTGEYSYPLGRIFYSKLNSSLERKMNVGLQKLKSICES